MKLWRLLSDRKVSKKRKLFAADERKIMKSGADRRRSIRLHHRSRL